MESSPSIAQPKFSFPVDDSMELPQVRSNQKTDETCLKKQLGECRVCGEDGDGYFFGALVCLPCKVSFLCVIFSVFFSVCFVFHNIIVCIKKEIKKELSFLAIFICQTIFYSLYLF